MNAIINAKLILEDSLIYDGVLLHENGRIVQMGKASEVAVPSHAEVVDAHGLYAAPGLIDIHNHGGPDFLFHEDPLACCKFFLTHGQTTLLPTFYCSLSAEEILDGLEKVQQATATQWGQVIAGLYM